MYQNYGWILVTCNRTYLSIRINIFNDVLDSVSLHSEFL